MTAVPVMRMLAIGLLGSGMAALLALVGWRRSIVGPRFEVVAITAVDARHEIRRGDDGTGNRP